MAKAYSLSKVVPIHSSCILISCNATGGSSVAAFVAIGIFFMISGVFTTNFLGGRKKSDYVFFSYLLKCEDLQTLSQKLWLKHKDIKKRLWGLVVETPIIYM